MSYNNSISGKREEKFAFLFAGPQESSAINFNKDVENMYNTLSTYYNYLDSNIHIVYGGTIAPSISGAVAITSQSELQTEIENFITSVDNFIVGELSGTADFNRSVVLFYFTGIGNNAGLGSLDIYEDLSNNVTSISPSWLSTELTNLGHGDYYDVHILMQQDYATKFRTEINNVLSLTNGANILPVSGVNTGGANGSDYTDQFTRALQFEALLVGTFADQLPSGETNQITVQISLQQAHLFVDSRLGTTNPNYQSRTGTDAFYFGQPEFLIQDSPDPAWWESEDIFLTHPASVSGLPNPDDYYAFYPADPTGNYNYVNIRVRNYGTHPVRQFDVGAILYNTGPAGPGTTFKATNEVTDLSHVQKILIPIPVPSKPFPVSLPVYAVNCMYDVLTTWQNNEILFDTQYHRCMRAKAKLSGLMDSELTDWINLTDVNNEGQRNLDVTVMSNRIKFYKVYNPFRIEKKFYMILSKKLEEFSKKISWQFATAEEGEREFKACKIRKKGTTEYIEFIVAPGSTLDLRVSIARLQKEELKEEIRVPFEFITELSDQGIMRAHKYEKIFPDSGSFGGFTILLRGGHSKVQGMVRLRGGKPASAYTVWAVSPDDEIQISTKTNSDGSFVFEELGFGIYSLKAIKDRKSSYSKDITVSAQTSKTKIELLVP